MQPEQPEQYTRPHIQYSPSQDLDIETTSENILSIFPRTSFDSLFSVKNKRGRPKNSCEGSAGSQKNIELPIQVENIVHDNERENCINFSTLDTLEFAVTRTTDQTSICRRAVMPL